MGYVKNGNNTVEVDSYCFLLILSGPHPDCLLLTIYRTPLGNWGSIGTLQDSGWSLMPATSWIRGRMSQCDMPLSLRIRTTRLSGETCIARQIDRRESPA